MVVVSLAAAVAVVGEAAGKPQLYAMQSLQIHQPAIGAGVGQNKALMQCAAGCHENIAGTIGLFDKIYLPLREGDNEVWFAVSERFGGWGIQAEFDDRQGIRVRQN